MKITVHRGKRLADLRKTCADEFLPDTLDNLCGDNFRLDTLNYLLGKPIQSLVELGLIFEKGLTRFLQTFL